MAWAAFRTRFWMSWLIWVRSASTGQRSLAMSWVQRMGWPARTNSADSRMVSTMEAAVRTGAPPRAKVSSCPVRFVARPTARSARSRSSSAPPGFRASLSRARRRCPCTDIMMLLKSWAIPPARVPRDSSFCTFIVSAWESSIRRCSFARSRMKYHRVSRTRPVPPITLAAVNQSATAGGRGGVPRREAPYKAMRVARPP